MPVARIGVIGGSGLYQMEGMKDAQEVEIETPFGAPSDAIVIGTLEGQRVAFLPRHGKGHRISPSELPVKANIFAMTTLGVEYLISISAVGSLREEIRPLDLVVPDQLIDRTKGRPSTFFGNGLVAHVGMADPFCPVLSGALVKSAKAAKATVRQGGTYVVMEGPQFSTRAESNLYRSWGASVIGMTALPEAKLAREAEMCYAILACSTDYDCWHDGHESVTVDMVVRNLLQNVSTAKSVLKRLLTTLPAKRTCACGSALKNAIITAPERIPARARAELAPLIGKYLK